MTGSVIVSTMFKKTSCINLIVLGYVLVLVEPNVCLILQSDLNVYFIQRFKRSLLKYMHMYLFA